MNLLQDIFKILHQPVQLLIAALMFAYKEPKRSFADSCCTGSNLGIFGFEALHYRITRNPFE